MSLVPELPDVRLQGKRIIAAPGDSQVPTEQGIQVVDVEECPHRPVSSTEMEVAGACEYLGGIYHYVYQSKTDNQLHQVAVGFSLTSRGLGHHVFLVSAPLELRTQRNSTR